MIGIAVRRLGSALPIMLIVSLLTFGMIHLIPGDPAIAIAGLSATPEQIANIRHDLGLDQPILGQLWRWYANLAIGDLGRSLLLGQPVVQVMLQRLPVTLALSAYALMLTLLVGLVIILFAVDLRWLPTGGYIAFTTDPLGWLATSTMPAISQALLLAGLLARITRSTMLEVLRQDYIRTARAKGLPNRRVVLKHALANALIPITTVVGIIVSLLISGSVVTETLFSIPGVGQVLTQAVLNRDYPMVQGGLLITTALLVLVNILVDVCYALLDPRVRYDGA